MYDKILVPLDGSKLSECALEHVKTLVTGCQASQVVLLTVLEEVQPYYTFVESQEAIREKSEQWRKTENEIKQKAESYLKTMADSLKKDGITVKTVSIQAELEINHGTAESIMNYAQNNKMDLIIMSTHGRSGVSRWAFGSVADKVVSHSKIPVLTITPKGCR